MANPEINAAIVGDIGGTNMRVGVATMRGVIDSRTEPTPEGSDQFFDVLGGLVEAYAVDYDLDIAAIGFPGPVEMSGDGYHGIIGPMVNVAGLNDTFDLVEEMKTRTHGLGIDFVVLNDAEAATYAAPQMLDATEHDNETMTTYITHSTGVGGDSIRQGKIVSRAGGMLSEYGWIPLLQPDGSYATWEHLVSGNAIRERYGGGVLSAEEIGREAPAYERAWKEVGQNMARGLAALTPILGTRNFVIGGGVSRQRHRYEEYMYEEFDAAMHTIPPGQVEAPGITFVPREFIDEIGLRGAFFAAEQFVRQYRR